MQPIGKTIIVIGVVLVVVGVVVWLFGDKFGWFGQLPGDIKVERKNVKFYAPITSMIVVSILLSLLLWAFRKFF
jgi:protein-S-isoprenylcysteine O-methyltransferase Ste14